MSGVGYAFDRYVFDVKIAVTGLSEREAEDILIAVLRERIDHSLVAPQRVATLLSIQPSADPSRRARLEEMARHWSGYLDG